MVRLTKDTLVNSMEVVTKPIEKLMGWFRKKPKREDCVNVVKEEIAIAKESMYDVGIELKDTTMEKISFTTKNTKEKVTNLYNEIGKLIFQMCIEIIYFNFLFLYKDLERVIFYYC